MSKSVYSMTTFPLIQEAIVYKDGSIVFKGDIQLACKWLEDRNISKVTVGR